MRIVLRVHPFLLPFPSFRNAGSFYFRNARIPANTLPTFNTQTQTQTQTLGCLRCRAMATEISPPIFQVKKKIELTETERKIFDRLLGTLRHFSLSNQLRVAGGWVRDKVLCQVFGLCLL